MARDVELLLGDHVLEHGDMLEADLVQGRLYGKEGAPVILIPGGISASRFICDEPETGPQVGSNWWPELVHAGGAIDLDKFQVLGLDLAPSGTNAHKRLTITTNDQAKRMAALLDHLNIPKVRAIIGTSYGGMVSLAFAQNYGEKVERLCLLGAAHRPFPMGVGLRGIQRKIVEFGLEVGRPEEGLKLARQLAMTTYRSPEEFTQRFKGTPTATSPFCFDVGDYLSACGDRYPAAMAVERFMALSESIDLHCVDPAKITTDTLLIATRSDQLAPPSEIQLLHDGLAGPSEMITIDSLFGHDSFLKETKTLAPLLSQFITKASHAK
ncbi:MAG: alpha/beta hydrolase [Robiginitomaculum sp.]|nr:MAG: alpha/beta hydrolase [Robiginitomaculum sp.]